MLVFLTYPDLHGVKLQNSRPVLEKSPNSRSVLPKRFRYSVQNLTKFKYWVLRI